MDKLLATRMVQNNTREQTFENIKILPYDCIQFDFICKVWCPCMCTAIITDLSGVRHCVNFEKAECGFELLGGQKLSTKFMKTFETSGTVVFTAGVIPDAERAEWWASDEVYDFRNVRDSRASASALLFLKTST